MSDTGSGHQCPRMKLEKKFLLCSLSLSYHHYHKCIASVYTALLQGRRRLKLNNQNNTINLLIYFDLKYLDALIGLLTDILISCKHAYIQTYKC